MMIIDLENCARNLIYFFNNSQMSVKFHEKYLSSKEQEEKRKKKL